MNRRQFIRDAAIITTGSLLASSKIKNSEIISLGKLGNKGSYISLYQLEKILMGNLFFLDKYPKELIEWYNLAIKNPDLVSEINARKQDLIDLSLSKIRLSLKKRLTRKGVNSLMEVLDSISGEIEELKKNEKLHYVVNNDQVVLLHNGLIYDKIPLKEFPRFDLYLNDEGGDEKKDSLLRFFRTLNRLSPDSEFIKRASEISSMPLEDITAFAYKESAGRPCAVSINGDIGRFQLNPKVLNDTYRYTTEQDNELAEFIKQNTSRSTFLEDLAANPELNIATGVNLMRYKLEKVKFYYVVAYYIGLRGASKLSNRTKYKLRNPDKITDKDLRNNIIDYYHDFRYARNNFRRIKDSLI
ncbi:MAG: transglycosylase SLT domain-containing protein [Nanoarchaeota archaeon]